MSTTWEEIMGTSGTGQRGRALRAMRWSAVGAAVVTMAALIAACSGGSNLAPIVKHHTPTPTATPTVALGLWITNSAGPNVPEFVPSQTTSPGISDPAPTLN